jgi:hypothetical protein
MDPCRHIFGTYRDYVPSYGLKNGYITELGGNTVHTNRFTYLDNATAAGTTNWLALTDNAANGTDFAYEGNHIFGAVASADAIVAENTSFYFENVPYTEQNYLTWTKAQTGGGLTTNAYLAFGELDGFCTGQPKPQYVPVCTPWVYGQRFTKDLIPGTASAYCEESQVCYGTYLPASTAQVRRTTTLCNGNLGLSTTTVVDTTLGSISSTGVKIVIQNLMLSLAQL